MNKNLQNGFILGAALQGKTETVEPQGEIEITENGTYDVSAYATADVEVNPYPVNVTFMNGENEYAKVGVASSDVSINAPTTNPPIPEGKNVFRGWGIDESNVPETFPKSFNEDTVLNALFAKSFVDDLYEHYGLSKSQYPYVFFKGQNSSFCYIRFCTSYMNTNKKITTNTYDGKTCEVYQRGESVNWSNLYETYQWIISNMLSLRSAEARFDYGNGENAYIFGNVSSSNIDVGLSPYQEL